MTSRRESWAVEAIQGLERLRARGEVQCVLVYLGGAWILYEAVALTAETFDLSGLIVRATVILLALGAILTIPVARWYHLTARATAAATPSESPRISGVPDVLEPALLGASRGVASRTALLVGLGSLIGFSLLFFLLWGAWAEAHESPVRDPRVSLVVFPFRTAGEDVDGAYGEAISDLLVVALDGTPGFRVVDPAAVWGWLRPERGDPARAPDAEEALQLARRAAARRFVTGSALRTGGNLELSARVYDAQEGRPLATLTETAESDGLGGAVQRLAIAVVSGLWEREQLPTVPEIERFATDNSDALKAYLEAKSLKRRARFQEAAEAIDRAVALDSTFALALAEQFRIRSWILWLNGEPFVGLRPIIEQAMRHRERLTPRNRMHIEAARALDDTDGERAAFLLERILALDSLDVEARHALAFTYRRDGWQLGKRLPEIIQAYDRAMAIDSQSIVVRAQRASLSLWLEDQAAAEAEIEWLKAVDTLSFLSRGLLASYRALQLGEGEGADVLQEVAAEPAPVVLTAVRSLRSARPGLAEAFFEELRADSLPVTNQRIGTGARTQLWFAQGRLSAADSVLAAGEHDDIRSWIHLYFVTTALAGVGDSVLAARSADWLSDYVPADSLLHYFYERPAWTIGWALGAYEATFGDTAAARVWADAIATLPGGGTPLDYRASLQADIEARLAVRRGDLDSALREARRAYEQWGIHSGSFQDFHPEVAMRFHQAEVLRELGMPERAEWLYRSLCPPHSWYGFYTARSSLELGLIAEARGDIEAARRWFVAAARLWERGDPHVTGQWLERARAGLDRLLAE